MMNIMLGSVTESTGRRASRRPSARSRSPAYDSPAAIMRQPSGTPSPTLAAQRVHAEAGEFSPLALRQAEMERERSADAVRAARHAAWLAWWRLEQAVAG
jgi:hypothetical protein